MKEYKILKYIYENLNASQRQMSEKLNISIGSVNNLIKNMSNEGLINIQIKDSKYSYSLSEKGISKLEEYVKASKLDKISINNDEFRKVKQAVILAAGEKKIFGKPVSFLSLEDGKIIDRVINILNNNGIEKIVIVTGYKSEFFDEYKNNKSIFLVKNDRYKWTGTMHSLSLAKKYIDDDFLLIENDMVFEERAITELSNNHNRDCMLITSESGSGDEALVEIRDGYVYKMSKDIHQFNKIDGEMIGLSKISYDVFNKMLELFKYNKNPYLNYEYALVDIGRDYKIGYIKPDGLVWSEIDNEEHYNRTIKYIYPKLKRKEEEVKINTLKNILCNELNINKNEIEKITAVGGMTNKNFKVTLNKVDYILRIPGNGTEEMISRTNERHNSLLANRLGIDTDILHFNEISGIKLSKFINNAETINPKTAKREDNMLLVTDILKKLHNSDIEFNNRFDVFELIEEYEILLNKNNGKNYDDYIVVKEKVLNLKNILNDLGIELRPCHNDTVPENFVKDGERLYLIDWEYSGMNDPMWDLAAHILECNFSEEDEELFLDTYFNGKTEEKYKTKILIFKICQDFLWSIWTNIKEAQGDDFGTYGENRYNRAKLNLDKIIN
ncbi:phosphocholine cytidylyltransferase/choline kinase family protein [Terrisporobacter sp.]|uniref:phosphocholine cytidylyltransferase/choline kinase family protein n=1 Tax=Terrisporobacter sp. TaxID=1965305 RepID=UPI00262C37A4|nr:phosphocholine cytidylyltransferase/choline kinase family protein [Terrisporobacter sp.]